MNIAVGPGSFGFADMIISEAHRGESRERLIELCTEHERVAKGDTHTRRRAMLICNLRQAPGASEANSTQGE